MANLRKLSISPVCQGQSEEISTELIKEAFFDCFEFAVSSANREANGDWTVTFVKLISQKDFQRISEESLFISGLEFLVKEVLEVASEIEDPTNSVLDIPEVHGIPEHVIFIRATKKNDTSNYTFFQKNEIAFSRRLANAFRAKVSFCPDVRQDGGGCFGCDSEEDLGILKAQFASGKPVEFVLQSIKYVCTEVDVSSLPTTPHHQVPKRKQSLLTPLGASTRSMSIDGGDLSPLRNNQRLNSTVDRTNLADAFADGSIPEAIGNMPICAEKSLLLLSHHFSLVAAASANPSKGSIRLDATGHFTLGVLSNQQVRDFLRILDDQIAAENLYTRALMDTLAHVTVLLDQQDREADQERESNELGTLSARGSERDLHAMTADDFVPVTPRQRSVAQSINAQISRHLIKCISEIRVIDTDLLVRLLQNTLHAAASIAGKDVILLLGNTGAGKSTTIHFLGGSEMKMGEDPVNGFDHIEIMHNEPQLDSFVTSSKLTSETLYINAIDLQLGDISFTLCDTPGFGDNRGIEIDIANGLGIANAVRRCHSVRPLFLISLPSAGDRFDLVVKLLKTPIEFISPVEEFMDTFTYWFTKYPLTQYKHTDKLYKIVNSKFEDLEASEADESVIYIFQDMLFKIEQRDFQAVVLDPCNDDPMEMLKELLSTPAIENPAEAFQNFATPENLSKVKVQLAKHNSSVENALKRQDYELVAYKLSQVAILRESLLLQESVKAHEDCVRKVSAAASALLSSVLNMLDKCALTSIPSIGADLEVCKGELLQLLFLECIRATHFKEVVSYKSSCASKIISTQRAFYTSVMEFCSEYNEAVQGGGTTDRRNVILHQRCVACLNTLNKMTEVERVFDRQFHIAADEILPGGLDSEEEKVVDSVVALLNDCTNALKGVVAVLVNDFDELTAKLDVTGALCQLLGVKYMSEVLGVFACDPSVYETRKGMFTQVVHMVYTQAKDLLYSSKKLSEYTTADYQCIHLASRVAHELSPAVSDTVLRQIFSSESCAVMQKYFSTLMDRVKSLVNHCATGVKETLAADASATAYTPVAAAVERILLLRGCKETANAIIDEFNELVLAVCNCTSGLREDVNRTVTLLSSGSWFIDCDDFIAKLDKLQGALCLKEVGDPGVFYSGEYEEVSEQLREAFVAIMGQIHETVLSYDAPEVLQRFVQPMKILAQFSQLFRHQIELDIDEEGKADIIKPLPTVQELTIKHAVTQNVHCTACKQILSDWRPFAKKNCKVCNTRVHRWCSKKVTLNGHYLRQCYLCRDNHAREMALGASADRATLVLGDVEGHDLDVLELTPPKSSHHEQFLPPPPLPSPPTPAPAPIVNFFTKIQRAFHVQQPPRPPPAPVVVAAAPGNGYRRGYAAAPGLPASMGTNRAHSVAPSANHSQSLRDKLNFNARDSLLFDAIEIGATSSIADIATRIILEFRGKVKKELVVARALFPPPHSFDTNYRLEYAKAWSAIQFLKNAEIFSFPEVTALDESVRAFSSHHFKALQQTLLSAFNVATSEDVNERVNQDKAKAVGEMQEVFSYLNYAIEYYQRHKSETLGTDDAVDMIADAAKDLHIILFLHSSEQINEWWLSGSTAKLNRHIQSLMDACTAETEFESLNMKLFTARSLSLLDTLLDETTQRYNDAAVALEDLIRSINNDVSFEIKSERYDVVAKFFAGKSLDTEAEREINRAVLDELTASVEVKVAAAQDKVRVMTLSVTNQSVTAALSKDLNVLRSAAMHVLGILNEPLRSTLKKDIYEIEFDLLMRTKDFLNTVDEQIPELALHYVEEVLQIVANLVTVFFGSSEGFDAYSKVNNLIDKGVIIDIESKRKTIKKHLFELTCTYRTAFQDAVTLCVVAESVAGGDDGMVDVNAPPDSNFVNTFGFSLGTSQLGSPISPPQRMAPVRQISLKRELYAPSAPTNAGDKVNPLDALVTCLTDIVPIKIVEALSAAAKAGSGMFYIEQEDAFTMFLSQMFEQLLAVAEDSKHPTDLRERVLSTVEKCIQVLPQAIVGKINTQLHECNQSLRYERENFKVEMAENSEISDLKVLMSRYRNHYQHSNFQQSYEMQLLLSKKIRSAISAFLSELAADNLVVVLEKLPPAWEEWVGYFEFCLRLHNNGGYSKQVARINRHHVIKDSESLDAVMQLCGKLYPAVRRLVQELKKVDMTDPTAFTIFSTHFDVFVRLMLAKYSSMAMFTALERSAPDMNNLEFQLQTILNNVAGAFKHYSAAIEKATAESGWPPIVASLLDLFQASDPLWPKLTGFISQHASLSEFSSIAAFIKTCKSYSATKQLLVDNLRATATALKITFLHNPNVMTKNGMDRDAFYAPFCAKYGNILSASALQYHFPKTALDTNELVTQCRDSVTGELQKIRDFVLELIKSSIPGPRAESYEEFNIWYDNLRAFRDAANKENSNAAAQAATTMMKEIDAQMSKKLDLVKRQADGTKEISKLIVLLAQMKQISLNVPLFKQSIDTHIDSVLYNAKANNNLQYIIDISMALTKATKDEAMGPVYQMILSDHSAFQGLSVSLFNDRIAKFNIDQCLDEKDGLSSDPVNDLNREKLRTYYDQFKTAYQQTVEEGLVDVPAAIETIKANVKALTKGNASNNTGNAGRVDRILKMMVNLFAYWTLSNSQYYSDMANMPDEAGEKASEAKNKDNQKYLLQPHAGQITSLFRIFGFDDRSQDIRNHLIQIGTGEGKSIILAVSSAVFALLGFTVHCACYSEYLSRRDYNAFSKMFTEFGISEFIMYGTFTELCEQFIEDLAGGDIRTSVEAMIGVKNNATSTKRPPSKRQKVLLIDEVDVFFSPDFYGNTYRPFAKIEDPTVSALIDKVWSERNPLPPFSQLQQSREYQACIRRFPGFDSLIAESVKTMFYDLKDLDEHKKLYKVLDDKIGYKDQDKISFNISYGYKTLFAYYKENRDGHISAASLASKKYMTIDCGAISFAEVPKMYTYRLGVSGTLRTLSDRQKELLRTEYTIHKYTFTPSVYGTSRQDYAPDRDIVLEPQNGHWSAITNEIVSRSKTGNGVARPVLVFFKTAEELLKYYKSNAPGALKHNMKYMTEEVSAADKDSIIRQATSPGSVTILSREFGRGTDFIIYDDKVSEAGGVHVIQTFLSEEVSEETQVKGRSARQGCRGSYSMVLSYSDLEKFSILETGPDSIETMKRAGAYMNTICAKRTAKVDQVWGGTQMSVQQIGKEHKEAMEFLTTLIANPTAPLLRTHLFKQNKSSYVEAVAKSRTVVLMDATGSMASLLTNAKNAVKTMFERANEIIDKTKKGATFDVQFVAYRNYNAPEDALLMASSWENSAMNLFTFMDTVEPAWGWGPEAVEVGFWHVNEEIRKDPLKGVSQVILIADQPPNSDGDVDYKRADRGESYWSGTRFSRPVYCNAELRKMIDKKVKVHSFYVADAAKTAFQDISKRSGGECEYLDLNSNPAGAANILTNMVTVKILSDLGGDECGAQMVAEYKKTFGYVK